MMNIKQLLILIGAVAVIAVQAYFLMDLYSKNKALQRSVKIIDKQLESEKKSNYDHFLALEEELEDQVEYNKQLHKDFEEIEKRFGIINKRAQDEKNSVNSINDANILAGYLTGRYR